MLIVDHIFYSILLFFPCEGRKAIG
jgi:hypothetical protein